MQRREKSSTIILVFASNLKRIRQEKGYTLRGLAAICNMGHPDIFRMEKGGINISLRTLELLAEALEVTPCDLLNPE